MAAAVGEAAVAFDAAAAVVQLPPAYAQAFDEEGGDMNTFEHVEQIREEVMRVTTKPTAAT